MVKAHRTVQTKQNKITLCTLKIKLHQSSHLLLKHFARFPTTYWRESKVLSQMSKARLLPESTLYPSVLPLQLHSWQKLQGSRPQGLCSCCSLCLESSFPGKLLFISPNVAQTSPPWIVHPKCLALRLGPQKCEVQPGRAECCGSMSST